MLVRRPVSALLSPVLAAGIRVSCAAESCSTPAATVLSVSGPLPDPQALSYFAQVYLPNQLSSSRQLVEGSNGFELSP